MFRARRYRSILIFTTVFILFCFYFTRERAWNVAPTPPVVDRPDVQPLNTPGSKEPAAAAPPLSNDIPHSPPVPPPAELKAPGTGSDVKPVDNGQLLASPVASQVPIQSPSVEQIKEEVKIPEKPGPLDNIGSQGQVVIPEDQSAASHWKKVPEQFPLPAEEIIKLPTGKAKTFPKLQAKIKDESSSDKLQRLQRLGDIKRSFEHAWAGYKANAMGHDELKPLRGGYRDPFMGWGATIVDTLDTLWIMDLKEEFSVAVDWVKKIDFTTSTRKEIPVFETAIRYMGGLLSAYDISGQRYSVLLDKAVELAEILMGAFDTPNRMPMLFYKWEPNQASEPHLASVKVVLAELGSLSLEFTRLAQLTSKNKYYDAIARITTALEKYQDETKLPGLWPMDIDASGCQTPNGANAHDNPIRRKIAPQASASVHSTRPSPTDIESYKSFLQPRGRGGVAEDAELANYDTTPEESTIVDAPSPYTSYNENCKGGLRETLAGAKIFGLGAPADSTYEYLPKEYMLLGGLNEQYRTMYEKAMDVARKQLVFRPMVKDEKRDLRFLATARTKAYTDTKTKLAYSYEGSHLACFAGGMFAVGSKIFDIESDMDLAAKLTDGCVWAYEATNTGIMPEIFHVLPCEDTEDCKWNEEEYRQALDPRETATGTIDRSKKEQKKEAGVEKAPSTTQPSSTPGMPAKRWHVQASPLPTAEVADRDAYTPLKTTPSHDDYVDARILEERLPAGMVRIPSRKYLLRPEAIESVFIMFRLTGDDYWRQKGWKMFQAISKYTTTELANSAIDDVTAQTPKRLDNMESFWLAETLKYFYLLFSDPSVVSLDEYVLNTEAHPFKRPEY